jgi:hypothetical protein
MGFVQDYGSIGVISKIPIIPNFLISSLGLLSELAFNTYEQK